MSSLHRVLGAAGAVVVTAVMLGAVSLAESAPAAAAAAPVQVPAPENGITAPEQWAEWDTNGDGRLSLDEVQQLSDEELEALRNWVSTTLDEVDDNDFRDWAGQHLGSPDNTFVEGTRLWDLLGIPNSGIGDDVRDAPGEIRDAAHDAGSAVVGGVADSAFDSVARRVGEGAADLTGYIGDELARTGRPQLEADWYRVHYQRMLGWAGLLLLPLALLAIGSAAIRGDTAKVGQALMQVPIVYLLGILAISAVSAASGLATAMSRSLVPGMQESSHDLAARITEMIERGLLGPGSLLLVGLLIALAALVTLVWLILAEAAIYAVVLFIPLAFAGRVWEPAKDWGRKLLTMAFALVAAKVVVFAVWALAADGLAAASAGDVPLRSALAIAALLLMTAISPSVVLRFVPMLEGAGAAPSAGGAARSGMSTAYYAGGLARMAGGGGGGRGGGGGGGLGVTGRVAGASARAPAGAGAGGGASGSGSSTPRPGPASQPESGGGGRRGSGSSGGGSESRSGEGPSSRPSGGGGRGRDRPQGTPSQGTQSGAEPAGGTGRSRGSEGGQARATPPTPPGSGGDGKLWRRRD